MDDDIKYLSALTNSIKALEVAVKALSIASNEITKASEEIKPKLTIVETDNETI